MNQSVLPILQHIQNHQSHQNLQNYPNHQLQQQYTSINEPNSYATFRKMKNMLKAISQLRIKDKRLLFVLMRSSPDLTVDTFFPVHGFTSGEFSVGHVLTENNRKVKK